MWKAISCCSAGTGLSCFYEDNIGPCLCSIETVEKMVRSSDASVSCANDQNVASAGKVSCRAMRVQLMKLCPPEWECRLLARQNLIGCWSAGVHKHRSRDEFYNIFRMWEERQT